VILSNTNIPLMMASLGFVVICLLSLGILIYCRQAAYRRSLIKKIKNSDDLWGYSENEAEVLSLPGETDNVFARFLSNIGIRFQPKQSTDEASTKLKFLRAGLRGKNITPIFWGTKILLAVSLPFIFILGMSILYPAMQTLHILIAVSFLILLGMAIPDLWLRFKTSRRKDRLVKAFPDALDLLVVCVEAGMGLDAAFHRVGKEMGLTHPDLSDEFKLLNLELRAGKSRRNALRNLAERTDIEDVSNLVTVLLQTDRFGTSVAQSLRIFSDSFRTARYQRAEEIAAKIGTKLIFPLVFFIFPSFFVVAVGPAAIEMYKMFINNGM